MNRTGFDSNSNRWNSGRGAGRDPVVCTARLFLLALTLFIPACPQPKGSALEEDLVKPDANPALPVKERDRTLVVASRLTEGPIQSFIEVSSDVASLNQVDIFPQLAGIRITEVLADEGDYVEKDTVMALLDDAEIVLEHEQAKVAHQEAGQRLEIAEVALKEAAERVESARIQAEKARKDYDKSLKMLEDELIAEEEFDTDRLAWEKASSDLDLAKLEKERSKLDLGLSRTEVEKSRISRETTALRLSRTRIKAPFNGFVTLRGATPGMMVSATSLLFTLVDSDILVANLYIPQEELLRIETGMPVLFTCDALPGVRFSGAIQIINPAIDPATGTVKLRARIECEEKDLLRPGMFVKARIITASRNRALLVPRKAVFYDDEKPTFFLIEDGGTVRKIHFKPGATTETALEIASTLAPEDPLGEGTLIVIVGQDNLKNGDRVEIKKENS